MNCCNRKGSTVDFMALCSSSKGAISYVFGQEC